MRFILVLVLLISAIGLSADLSKDFTDKIINGKFKECEKYFSKELAEAIKPGRLEKVWQGLIASTGPVVKVVEDKADEREEFTAHTVTIKFENIYMDMLLTVEKNDLLSGIYFKPSTYTEGEEKLPPYTNNEAMNIEEVEFDCAGYTMKGTIIVPDNMRSFPIFIMATGSGPNNRDEKIGSNKPFRDLAFGLASHGVATLRYDKRTLTAPTIIQDNPNFDIDNEYTEEVNAAYEFISKKWKGRNIYFLGHSMGAFMAPRLLNSNANLQGAVMLAGNARPTENLVMEQVEYLMALQDEVDEERLAIIKARQQQVKKLKTMDSDVKEPLLLGLSKAYWLSMNMYDQIAEAENVTQPMFVMQGERDYQVTMEDYDKWKKFFDGSKNWTFKSYPKLNHLFMEGEGKSTPSEYMKANFVTEEVIIDIANWVKKLEKMPRKK